MMFTVEPQSEPSIYKSPSVIKIHIHSLLLPYQRPTVLALVDSQEDIRLAFLVYGLYLDFNSRSVAAEAYFLPITNDVPQIDPETTFYATAEHLKWWRNTLPSMVESTRTWTHDSKCEYKTEGIPRPGPSPICSCGTGKVGQEFKNVPMWRKFNAHVTRIAILPIFDVPWLTPSRQITDDSAVDTATRATGPTRPTVSVTETKESIIDTCKFCLKKEAAKKCGKCMSVMYCSRTCQRNDWKAHKKVCEVKE